MIAAIVVIAVLMALWLGAAILGLVFKLCFALIGGLFSVVAGALGLLIGGLALTLLAPLLALALLPVCLPFLLLAALVWAIVRSARAPVTSADARIV